MSNFSNVKLTVISCFVLISSFSVLNAQGTYIDLTLVESTDYNKPLANFSREAFSDAFKISSSQGDVLEENLNNALIIFINLLVPKKSFVIQHEPTYYFIFQYNTKTDKYLIMNNSIGEKNEAIYTPTFEDGQFEMLKLLQIFYSDMPVYSIMEFSTE